MQMTILRGSEELTKLLGPCDIATYDARYTCLSRDRLYRTPPSSTPSDLDTLLLPDSRSVEDRVRVLSNRPKSATHFQMYHQI
jgi:hypothetical protein